MNSDPQKTLPSVDGSALLVFRLEEEAFAINVSAVHEILDNQTPTIVPNADAFAPGVINVRGVVVPVVDVRHRLTMSRPEETSTSRMIVVEVLIDAAPQKLAFDADLVEDVITADIPVLEKVPDLGATWPQAYLRGAFRHNGELLILLNTETLFQPQAADKAAA